jgi:hypothetical protein
MSEIENNQINFSNILLQEESYFFDNSLEFEINDLIYENTENDKQSDSNSNSDIEEMVIYNKQIPKIFPNTKKLFCRNNSIKEKEENEKIEYNPNLNSFNIINSVSPKKNNVNIRKSLSRKTTLDIPNKVNLKIDNLNIILGEDKRRLISLENLPSKFKKKKFKEEIDSKGFKGKYNFIYFHKIKSKNIVNIYINFLHEFHIILFYHIFNGKKINCIDKIINIKYCNLDENELKGLIIKDNLIEENNNNNILQQIEISLLYLYFLKKFISILFV